MQGKNEKSTPKDADLRVLGISIYLQMSVLQRAAKAIIIARNPPFRGYKKLNTMDKEVFSGASFEVYVEEKTKICSQCSENG